MNEIAGLVFPEIMLEIESRIITCKKSFITNDTWTTQESQ